MKITNTSRYNTHNFVLNGKAKDGVPPTGHVGPGESDDLDINMDVEAAHLKALASSGEVSVPASIAAKAEKMAAANAVPSADKATQ